MVFNQWLKIFVLHLFAGKNVRRNDIMISAVECTFEFCCDFKCTVAHLYGFWLYEVIGL